MASFEIPDQFNIASYMLDRHIKEGRGNRPAIYYKDQAITWSDVVAQANQVGNALLDLGVEQENRVMICLPDCPEFISSYYGIIKIGAVAVPVNTMALPKDYLYFLNDSRAKVLITTSDLAPVFSKISNELNYLKHFVVLGESQPGQINFDAMVGKAATELTTVATSKDDMAFWLYSSGTTGTPKGVVHLHHDLVHSLPPHCTEVMAITPDDISFSISKLYFSYGRNNSLDSPSFQGSAVILNPEKPDPETLMNIIEKYRPTLFYSVPSSYSALLNFMEKTGRNLDLSSVRLCVSAGEALPKVIYDKWREIFNVEILDGVGSTDVGMIYLSNRPGKVRHGSCGKLLTGFEGKLMDENKAEVAVGDIGTMWVKNDGTTPGYWNKHDKTKQTIHGEWFCTGDQFYQDKDGYYWYAGRDDDMLKPGGLWLSPMEIEDVLLAHPLVDEVAVVAEGNESGLDKPVAFVVAKEGCTPTENMEKELSDFVRSKTAHYKCPRKIYFVDELPRTATGKIQRYKLRVQLKQERES
ncbi:MAG: benzoate-CoA ligase family protein [Desulfobacula sp.]|nr:benzoate-CoA ligase family protein [Desulfobacula sp.]